MKPNQFLVITLIFLLLLAGGAGQIRAADAVVGDGSPESCTEAAFDTALFAAGGGGGTITFNCGANPHTIEFTNTKTLTDDIIIDGGDLITLSGGNVVRPFLVAGNPIEIRHLTVTQGQALFGGAIQIATGGYLTLTDSYLSQNTADSAGGGLHNDGGTAVLLRVTLSNNSTSYGGGIYNSGDLTLLDVTLVDNTATNGGGGLYNDQNANLSNVTLATNSSGDGGGIFNSAAGVATMTNATLSGNQANYGGGLFNNGAATLTHVTIAGNQADGGGGGGILHNNGGVPQLSMTNVILTQNTSPTPANDQCLLYKTPDSLTYSLWSGTSCGTTTANGNQPDTDPLLAPLDFTGTGLPTELTMTHALLLGSPAEGMGTCVGGPATDQRGVDRPQGAGCDVGAVETIPIAPTYGVILSGTETMGGAPGTAVTHTLTLTNTGNIADTFDLTLDTAVWPTQINPNSVTLAAYESTTVTVVVDIPLTALGGETDGVGVTAVSQGDATQTAQFALTTVVNYVNYLPMVIRP